MTYAYSCIGDYKMATIEELKQLGIDIENLYSMFKDTIDDLETDKCRPMSELELMWEFSIYVQLYIENAENDIPTKIVENVKPVLLSEIDYKIINSMSDYKINENIESATKEIKLMLSVIETLNIVKHERLEEIIDNVQNKTLDTWFKQIESETGLSTDEYCEEIGYSISGCEVYDLGYEGLKQDVILFEKLK